ncbi:MAG: hypothetical protein WAM30_16490 [Candidatus Dormiibacterota bacterium]
MKFVPIYLVIVGLGLLVGGVVTVLFGSGETAAEYHFSGSIGAIGGAVMILTAALFPATGAKRR